MVLEVAVLDVRPGESPAFEAAFREAQAIISESPGYERPSRRAPTRGIPLSVATYIGVTAFVSAGPEPTTRTPGVA